MSGDPEQDDVFDLQDRITQEIVAALEVQLTLGEQLHATNRMTAAGVVEPASSVDKVSV